MTAPPERYSVHWSGPAKRAITGLPEKVALAAIEFIYGPLAEMPLGSAIHFASNSWISAAPVAATTESSIGSTKLSTE